MTAELMTIIVVAVVVSLAVLLKATVKITKTGIKVAPLRKHRVKDFLSHDLFAYFDTVIARGADLVVEDKRKQAVIEAFYKIKVEVFKKRLTEFIVDYRAGKRKPRQFLAMVYAAIDEYNQIARIQPITLPNHRVIDGVPLCFIEFFDGWHNPHIKAVATKVQSQQDSEFYATDDMQVVSMIDVLHMGFMLTEQDLVASANAMNGTLICAIEEACRD